MEIAQQRRWSDLIVALESRGGDRKADELGSLLLLGSHAIGNAADAWISDELESLLLDDL